MGCDTCNTNKREGRPPCGWHRIGESDESKGGKRQGRSIMFNNSRVKNAKNKIIEFILNNSGMSASPQRINRELGFNYDPSWMATKIRYLKRECIIYEILGRYYHHTKLPEKLEKYI